MSGVCCLPIYIPCSHPAWLSWSWSTAAPCSPEVKHGGPGMWGEKEPPTLILKLLNTCSPSLPRGPNYWQTQATSVCNPAARCPQWPGKYLLQMLACLHWDDQQGCQCFIQPKLSGYKQNRGWCSGVLSRNFASIGRTEGSHILLLLMEICFKKEGETTTTTSISMLWPFLRLVCQKAWQKFTQCILSFWNIELNWAGLYTKGNGSIFFPTIIRRVAGRTAVLHWELRFLQSPSVPFYLPLLAATSSLLHSPHQLSKGQ